MIWNIFAIVRFNW